jgi:hypothetical protein
MSHFARVLEGIVKEVIVAEQEYVNTLSGEWIQTSYNTCGGVHYNPATMEPDDGTPLRKNYAAIGGVYDAVRDAFYSQQPYPSWVLNEESCIWEPPVAMPDDYETVAYTWDEETTSWVADPPIEE